nr:MAG TPA: hypothetical protein [Caudoviricetes sp.]
MISLKIIVIVGKILLLKILILLMTHLKNGKIVWMKSLRLLVMI